MSFQFVSMMFLLYLVYARVIGHASPFSCFSFSAKPCCGDWYLVESFFLVQRGSDVRHLVCQLQAAIAAGPRHPGC